MVVGRGEMHEIAHHRRDVARVREVLEGRPHRGCGTRLEHRRVDTRGQAAPHGRECAQGRLQFSARVFRRVEAALRAGLDGHSPVDGSANITSAPLQSWTMNARMPHSIVSGGCTTVTPRAGDVVEEVVEIAHVERHVRRGRGTGRLGGRLRTGEVKRGVAGEDRTVDDRVTPRELDLEAELVLVPEQRLEHVRHRDDAGCVAHLGCVAGLRLEDRCRRHLGASCSVSGPTITGYCRSSISRNGQTMRKDRRGRDRSRDPGGGSRRAAPGGRCPASRVRALVRVSTGLPRLRPSPPARADRVPAPRRGHGRDRSRNVERDDAVGGRHPGMVPAPGRRPRQRVAPQRLRRSRRVSRPRTRAHDVADQHVAARADPGSRPLLHRLRRGRRRRARGRDA